MKRPRSVSRAGHLLSRWSLVRSYLDRRARASTAHRWLVRVLVTVSVLAVIPVPWLHVVDDNPPGWAWRLDGRLVVDGELIDPAGRWSWLTVGRPPLLIEAARDRMVGSDDPARDMRLGGLGTRPAQSEPLAAAVGLNHAGAALRLDVVVEVSEPRRRGLPDRAVIVEIDGRRLVTRADLDAALEAAGSTVEIVTADERRFEVSGPDLPFERMRVIDLAPPGLSAAIGGPFSRLAPIAWFRRLSLGSSHGMMVALVTYVEASDPHLARGRHVAGTGGIRADGTVTRIGGLPAKARAAHRAGADVLFFPADQASDLADFTPARMALVPIETLSDAISYLEVTEVGQDRSPAGVASTRAPDSVVTPPAVAVTPSSRIVR